MTKEEYEPFLKKYYWEQILTLNSNYPERQTLIIDFKDLNIFNFEIAHRFLNQPEEELKDLRDSLLGLDLPSDVVFTNIKVAMAGYEDITSIQKIGTENINKFVSIEGRITKISPKYQKIINAAFKCQRCGKVTFMPQIDGRFVEPFECEFCERRGPFVLLEGESIFEDQQTIVVQELNEFGKLGQTLRDILVDLRGNDMIEKVPGFGAECNIYGTLKLAQKTNREGKSSLFTNYIMASHIEPKEADIDLTLSAADKRDLLKLAEDKDIFKDLVDSMSPGVMGYPEIKLSLLAAAVGGGKNHNKALREYAHIAVVGDPGTAKTILVESLRLLVPRAQYAAGKGASGVGLTVAAVKDDMGGGGYVAQAGALVLADRGLMIIDELDKFEREDIQRLNTALESGCFPVNKGGINQTFNSRCPVIAILNPKLICFDKDVDLDEQINIPADTLSRFDLIFKIKDVVEEERDTKLAEHMGKRWKALCTDNGDIKGKIPLETMRKYLAFAKSFQPKLSDEVILRINEYYVKEIRQKHRGGPRDYNAIARITKAITKLRLSDVCTIEDVEQAIALHTASQKAIEDPTTGTIDSRILYGYNSSQVERNKLIIGSIRDIGHNGDGVHFTDILTKVASLNITSDQLSDTIHKLRFSGEIIEIEDHVFRVI